MAYAATLWYAIFTGLFIFILVTTSRKNLGRALLLITTTIILNLYWILPNIYFAKMHSQDVIDSKVNRLFSPEAFAKNQEFGNLKNTAVFKNFLFDWELYNFKSQLFELVLKPWISHLENPWTASFGYLIFAVALVGVIIIIIKKQRTSLALLPVFLLSLLIILNGAWPINNFFIFLSTKFPIAAEALRFPFTKFSILLMLTTSIFLGYGLNGIMSSLNKPKIKFFLATFFFAGSLWYFAPAFTGNLINPAMRIQIPNEYFQMFDWFKHQDENARVAILPINSFWNWTYYSWGYQGAGFLQFGIPQPILDRDYDRWNPANEQYEREMAYAIYSQNPQIISAVLSKFNIRFILFDNSVSAPGSTKGSTLSWLIPSLLSQTAGVTEKIRFGQNIVVYEVKENQNTAAINLYQNLPSVGPAMAGGSVDNTYLTTGSYQTQPTQNDQTDFTRGYFTKDERFNGPNFGKSITTVSATQQLNPLVDCGNAIDHSRQTTNNLIRYASTGGAVCDYFDFPNLDHSKNYIFEITSRNISGFPLEICISNNLTRHCDLFVRLGEQKDFKTETYLLPGLKDFGSGYTVNLYNYAVSGQTSVNEIKNLTISEATYTTPNQNLALNSTDVPEQFTISHPNPAYYKINFQLSDFSSQTNTLVLNQSFDNGWKAWLVTSDKQPSSPAGRQVTNQKGFFSFLSLFTYHFSPLPHVLVNNWANGWTLNKSQISELNDQCKQKSESSFGHCDLGFVIYLFFLPQLLEWLGFALLPIPFILILLIKHSKN